MKNQTEGIIKIEDKGISWYLGWSHFYNAPTTYGMSLIELKNTILIPYVEEFCGSSDKDTIDFVLKEINKKKSTYKHSLEKLLETNEAGPNRERLTKEEIVKRYCLDRDIEIRANKREI